MYRLVFLSGRYQGKRLLVRQAITLAGRDPACHLMLTDDDGIAPRHVRFEEGATGVSLTPLSPDHPLRINGETATGTVRLAHNDEVTLGETRIQFQNIIAPHARVRPSPGLLQPVTLLFIVLILAVEALLLGFLVDWPRYIIRPDTEAADLAFAEKQRAAAEAEAPASVVSLPGTASPLPSAEAAVPGPAGTDAAESGDPRAAAPSPSPIQNVLDVADFAPADTNVSLVVLPTTSTADRRLEDARRLLTQAIAAADFADYPEAVRLLNQIHEIDPGFLPAHVEHARLIESRGDLDGAQQRWRQIQGIAPEDSPFHAQAAEQRERLARLQAMQTQLLQPSEVPDAAHLPRHIRIVSPELQRLPADADVAEMRVLSATLELAPSEQLFQNAVVQVFITFYDKAPDREARPTRVITTPSPVILNAAFSQRRSLPIEATYVVPRGLRAQESRESDAEYAYYGHTIHVFAGQILQDAFGKPRRLLDFPLHFPAAAD
ncbi:MAG: hypothetical protein GX548_11010 [Lentisphaerae bacterium]|nr:hypothetical protein [Lentisphaerota bacterium]